MHRLTLVVLVVGAILLAGCLTGDEAAPENEGPLAQDTSPAEAQEASEADTSDASGSGALLASPPGWLPGEHWTVQVDSTLLDEPITWTRVVAGATTDGYLVGQPADDVSTLGLLLHIPGLGRVSQANLSYSVHGSTFTPVAFPLEDGREWETRFEGDPVNATVEVQPDGTARIHYCCSRNITAVYDPEIRAISEMTVDDGFITYRVTDHGFDHQGEVRVPADRQIVFLTGRFAGALGADGDPGPPVDRAQVPDEVDRVAFTQIVGSLDLTPAPETGFYLERTVHPNGTTYVAQQAGGSDGLTLTVHDVGNASGTWRFEHLAVGPGLAFSEGIGYRLVERSLG